MLALLCAGGAGWAWVLLGVAVLTRYAVALAVGRMVLRDQQVTRWLALVPLRDLVAVLVWFMGCWGHTVTWRGKTFELKNGKLADTLPVLHSAAGDGSGSNRPSE
jgi:ceramide glucosyltransferase